MNIMESLFPGNTDNSIRKFLEKADKQRRERDRKLLPNGLKRVVLVLEGDNLEDVLGEESEAKRNPFNSLPPRIPRGPGFQT